MLYLFSSFHRSAACLSERAVSSSTTVFLIVRRTTTPDGVRSVPAAISPLLEGKDRLFKRGGHDVVLFQVY